MKKQFLIVTMFFLVACAGLAKPVAMPQPIAVVPPTVTVVTPTPRPTPTLAPYEQYTTDYLRKRTYGGGKIEVLQKLTETDLFSSYSIRYPSDGLNIYGFMSIPKGTGPFPVIIGIHGYAPYGTYDTFNPGQGSANFFASNQYIIIMPGLRNHPPSDHGDNLLRVGMTVDVMNMIALVKARDQLPVELASADTSRLGLWGISMGAEIGLRVLTISPDIKAAVFYSPLTGSTDWNARQLYEMTGDEEFTKDFTVPLEMLDRVSPSYQYYKITTVVQLNHGMDDHTVPISGASATCEFLKSAGVLIECIFYENTGHTFGPDALDQLRQNALEFYRLHLSP